MECFEAEIIMLKELEGIASDRETDALIRHMLTCPDCLRHFRFLKSVVDGEPEVPERTERTVAPSEDFEVRVMTKIRNINAVTVVRTTTQVIKLK